MVSNLTYRWNHDFPKMIRDSGFIFNIHKHKICINWNDIKAINIDKLIQERDFTTVDSSISEVLNCQLEHEFDTRILDSGFVKLFRLSQLSVEYLLECRKNLDTTVVMLKSQLETKDQEIEKIQVKLNDCLKEAKRRNKRNVKRRNRSETENSFKGMFVKNDNYLINNGQYNMQFHKCSNCEKVFMNQFFLESHVMRRHPMMKPDVPDSSLEYSKNNNEVQKLSMEIKELKEALHMTQINLKNKTEDPNNSPKETCNEEEKSKYEDDQKEHEMISKEAFEKWKEEEKERMLAEISVLKSNILAEGKQEFENIQKDIIDKNEKEKAQMLMLIQNQEQEIKHINDLLNQKIVVESKKLNADSMSQENTWKKKLQDSENHHREIILELQKQISSVIENSKKNEENNQKKIEQLESSIKNHLERKTQNFFPFTPSTSQEKINSDEMKDESMDFRKRKLAADSQETLPPYREKLQTRKSVPQSDSDIEDNNKVDDQKGRYKSWRNKRMLKKRLSNDEKNKKTVTKMTNFKTKYEPISPQQSIEKQTEISDIKESKVTSGFEKLRSALGALLNEKISQLGVSSNSAGISNKQFKKSITTLSRKQNTLNQETKYANLRKTLLERVDQKLQEKLGTKEGTKAPDSLSSKKDSRDTPPKMLEVKNQSGVTDSDMVDFGTDSDSTEGILNSTIRTPNTSTFDFPYSDMKTSTPIKGSEESLPPDEQMKSMYAGISSSSSESDFEKNNMKKAFSESNLNAEDISSIKKSVLKSATSAGSLAKKKVLFDLDNDTKSQTSTNSGAIEVKSKSKWNENINTDSDSDWNFQLDNESTKVTVHVAPSNVQTSPQAQKPNVLQLARSIEAQLNDRISKPPLGGINTLHTSTGEIPIPKPRTSQLGKEKDVSDLEVSDWSIDDFLKSK